MNSDRYNLKYILLFFVFFLLSSLFAQNNLQGEYYMIQYLVESGSHRGAGLYLITADGDSSGTWKEIHPAFKPDGGLFKYDLQLDHTFSISDSRGDLQGTIDNEGEISFTKGLIGFKIICSYRSRRSI